MKPVIWYLSSSGVGGYFISDLHVGDLHVGGSWRDDDDVIVLCPWTGVVILKF